MGSKLEIDITIHIGSFKEFVFTNVRNDSFVDLALIQKLSKALAVNTSVVRDNHKVADAIFTTNNVINKSIGDTTKTETASENSSSRFETRALDSLVGGRQDLRDELSVRGSREASGLYSKHYSSLIWTLGFKKEDICSRKKKSSRRNKGIRQVYI